MPMNINCQRWTTQQALAVYELLAALQQSVWEQHHVELSEIFAAECCAPAEPKSELADVFDDDIPF